MANLPMLATALCAQARMAGWNVADVDQAGGWLTNIYVSKGADTGIINCVTPSNEPYRTSAQFDVGGVAVNVKDYVGILKILHA